MSANRTKPAPVRDPNGRGSAAAPEIKIENNTTGRVKFDDRGNAIWEWAVSTPAVKRDIDSTDRMLALEDPSLSIALDAPTPFDGVKPNPLGTKKGYDPYDSGKLGKRPESRVKTDLRRLSEFMKLKRQAAGNKDGEGHGTDEAQQDGEPGPDGEAEKGGEI